MSLNMEQNLLFFSSKFIIFFLVFLILFISNVFANCSLAAFTSSQIFKQNTTNLFSHLNCRKVILKWFSFGLLSPFAAYSCLRTHSAESVTQYILIFWSFVQHRFVVTIDDSLCNCVFVCVQLTWMWAWRWTFRLYRIVLYSNNTKRRRKKTPPTPMKRNSFYCDENQSYQPRRKFNLSKSLYFHSFGYCFVLIYYKPVNFLSEKFFFSAFFTQIKLFNFNQHENVCRIPSKTDLVSSNVRRFWLLACKMKAPTEQYYFILHNSIYHLWVDTNAIKYQKC